MSIISNQVGTFVVGIVGELFFVNIQLSWTQIFPFLKESGTELLESPQKLDMELLQKLFAEMVALTARVSELEIQQDQLQRSISSRISCCEHAAQQNGTELLESPQKLDMEFLQKLFAEIVALTARVSELEIQHDQLQRSISSKISCCACCCDPKQWWQRRR